MTPFIPILFFDGPARQATVGINTISNEIFFLRDGNKVFEKENFHSLEDWNSKIEIVAAKLHELNEEAFNELLEEMQKIAPDSHETKLLSEVIKKD